MSNNNEASPNNPNDVFYYICPYSAWVVLTVVTHVHTANEGRSNDSNTSVLTKEDRFLYATISCYVISIAILGM
jgi:hypothetical protein